MTWPAALVPPAYDQVRSVTAEVEPTLKSKNWTASSLARLPVNEKLSADAADAAARLDAATAARIHLHIRAYSTDTEQESPDSYGSASCQAASPRRRVICSTQRGRAACSALQHEGPA